MIDDYTVVEKYKNEHNNYVAENTIPFNGYMLMIGEGLKRCLNDIENSFREKSGEEKYNPRNDPAFCKIRKRILDAANAVERLPDTMCFKGTPIKAYKASEYIADIVNNI